MPLSNKQKAYIRKNYKSLSTEKISENLNAQISEVNEFINTIKITKKYPVWFYIVPLLIPIIFFILLEISLTIGGYGKDFSTFITISEDYEDKWFINPDLPFKYFSNISSPPSVSPDAFDKVKKENAIRIFVLGGSSAAGWPFNSNASFPREIKRRLQILFPENEIEVINMGVSAINSYSIKDILPDVIDKDPDLVLIYAGHNEFYGALGVGSSESLGNFSFIINSIISLREYRTVQLIRDFLSYFAGLFADEQKLAQGENETLMSRMVGEALIPYQSDLFNLGIKQFQSNFDDILSKLKEKEIPVLIGTLTSNLKIKPFVSVETNNQRKADDVFNEAESFYKNGNYNIAREFYIKAKDLDALRFRAPEILNETIVNLAEKYKYDVVKIDSLFFAESPNGITGFNIMVDHLHPTNMGYRLIGKEYFNSIINNNLLVDEKIDFSRLAKVDSLSDSIYPFTKLDSTIADLRIRLLVGAYPFVPKGTPNYLVQNFKRKNIVDSIAADVISRKFTWKQGHLELADYYFKKNMMTSFKKELDVITADRPYDEEVLGYTAERLISKKLYNEAIPYIVKLYDLRKDLLSAKWLGTIALEAKNYDTSIKYLEIASQLDSTDAQILYNLSGAYYNKGYNFKTLQTLEKCLRIRPDYPQAQQFYKALKDAVIRK